MQPEGMMQLGFRTIAREVGTAFAVLAMYALLVLAPWHQASMLQHDLDELGYVTIGAVDICSAASTDDEQAPEEIKCPIAGIGKFDFALLEPGVLELPASPDAERIAHRFAEIGGRTAILPHSGQARAPPVTV